MSTILTTLVGDEWEQHRGEKGGIYYVNVTTQEKTPFIPLGYEDRIEDDWEEKDIGRQHLWINQRTGRISMTDPFPPPPKTYLDLITFKAFLTHARKGSTTDRYFYREPMNIILNWWFYNLENFMVHPRTKVVDIMMPAVTMTKVMELRGEPLAIRDYLLVETRAPGEENVYAIIQYGMIAVFYKWEENKGTALAKKLHLVRDVDKIMSLLEYMSDNPLPLIDFGPNVSDL